MSSPEFAAEPIAHVERTIDPAVLRWMCTSPSLAALPDGPRQPEGPEWAAFTDAVVEVVAGSVEIRLPDAAGWAQHAQPMHLAMLAALRQRADWLFDAAGDAAGSSGISVSAIQRIVDGAAGAITGAHGGEITVAGIDAGVVTLRLAGACHGCRFTDDTVQRLVEPAMRRAYPQLTLTIDHSPRT
jgi:Fe-S cluster biogenesis protein NfuA